MGAESQSGVRKEATMTRLIDADALMEWGMKDVPYKGSVKRVLIQSPTVIPADIETMYYPQVEGITPTVVLSRKEIE